MPGGLYQGSQDLIGMLRELIQEETKWLRHYQGKVLKNQDPEGYNRVLVSIPELGWVDEKMAFWAFPRDKNGVSLPDVGANVEIYFMNGNPSRPVYLGLAWEGYNRSPVVKNFDGKPSTHILFEDPKSKDSYVKYSGGSYKILGKDLTLLEGTEPFVLGTQLNTFLTTLVANINVALGTKLNGSGSTGTLTPPSGILSTTIKGK